MNKSEDFTSLLYEPPIRQIMEENRPKGETVPTPVSVNVEFKSKAEALQGNSTVRRLKR